MPRPKSDGGGKSKQTLTLRLSVEGEKMWDEIKEEKIKTSPLARKLSKSAWIEEVIGFTHNQIFSISDRLRLRGIQLTKQQRQQIDSLGEIIERWPKLSKDDQHHMALRVESLLREMRAKTKLDNDTGSEQPKEGPRSSKESRLTDSGVKLASSA